MIPRSVLVLAAVCGLAGVCWVQAQQPASAPSGPSPSAATAPAGAAKQARKSNLDYWLEQGKIADSQAAASGPAANAGAKTAAPKTVPLVHLPAAATAPAPAEASGEPTTQGTSPFEARDTFVREDAVPGVVEFSNGQITAGWMYTTRDKPFNLWVDSDLRYHRIPFVDVLSIKAIVVDANETEVWRWEGMGVPTRVFTGQTFPERRMKWEFHLIDDTVLTGDISGQPIVIERDRRKAGPYVLAMTVRGPNGMKLPELLYMKQIIISRRLMQEVIAAGPEYDLDKAPSAKTLGEDAKAPGVAGAQAPTPTQPAATKPASTK